MLENFQNHLKLFRGCMLCWGVPMPPQPRDCPRVFWGLVLGNFMCGFWIKYVHQVFPPERKLDLYIDEKFVPNSAVVVKVRDFSRWPAGRCRADGPFSGEAFREGVLLPEFEAAESLGVMLVVDMNGTLGYGSSWLDEAFGKMTEAFTADRIFNRMRIVTVDHSVADEVARHIDYAEFKRENCA